MPGFSQYRNIDGLIKRKKKQRENNKKKHRLRPPGYQDSASQTPQNHPKSIFVEKPSETLDNQAAKSPKPPFIPKNWNQSSTLSVVGAVGPLRELLLQLSLSWLAASIAAPLIVPSRPWIGGHGCCWPSMNICGGWGCMPMAPGMPGIMGGLPCETDMLRPCTGWAFIIGGRGGMPGI